MPRYLNSATDQFWEITLAGTMFRTRFGATGSAGEESVKVWPDAQRAIAEHDKVIAFKEARGFVLEGTKPRERTAAAKPAKRGPAHNAALVREIAKNLDDLDAFRVYGDWLSEAGDVRGELIALQTKPGHEAAAAELIEDNREHFLGDLHELSEELLGLTWRNGFIEAVRIERVSGGADADERTAGELLRAIFAHASGAFVRSLAFGTVEGVEDGMVRYQSIPEVLGDIRPPHVESIHVGDWNEWEVSWSELGDASGFWKLPSLATLILRVGSMDLGTVASTSLRSLEIITGGLSAENIRSIVKAKLPALERLHIYFGSQHYGATGTVRDIAPLLSSKAFPKLCHLGLVNAEFTDELCTALGTSPLVRQLETLDLSKGTMSSDGAAALAAHGKAFAHLAALDVSENYLSDDDVRGLKRVAKQVIATSQRETHDDGERYAALGE